jgi:hypothetical protein
MTTRQRSRKGKLIRESSCRSRILRIHEKVHYLPFATWDGVEVEAVEDRCAADVDRTFRRVAQCSEVPKRAKSVISSAPRMALSDGSRTCLLRSARANSKADLHGCWLANREGKIFFTRT